jgi:hypothetical protein
MATSDSKFRISVVYTVWQLSSRTEAIKATYKRQKKKYIYIYINATTQYSPRSLLHNFFLNSGLWGYWHCGHSWPIVPASGDSEDDCGEAGGM